MDEVILERPCTWAGTCPEGILADERKHGRQVGNRGEWGSAPGAAE